MEVQVEQKRQSRWRRARRQRPLGLARQTLLAWSSAALSLIFFALTVSYAHESTRLSVFRFVHSSSSNTILVLRVLSEIAGVFLGSTIYSTFEVVQWLKVSRPRGLLFPEFLALQASTGTLGLLVLAFGRGLSPVQWPMAPRIVATIRLISQAAVPLMGVLIMGNVNTQHVYQPGKNATFPVSFGMEAFNASVAPQLGVMEDLLFNMDYPTFLFNPVRAIDITPTKQNGLGCLSRSYGFSERNNCSREVVLAQSLQLIERDLSEHRQSQDRYADVVLSLGQQVYVLSFEESINVQLNDNTECKMMNSGPAYYKLCMTNNDKIDGRLEAYLTACPPSVMLSAGCLNNSTWERAAGWTTSLQASLVTAAVAYDRKSGAIVSHDLSTNSTPTEISAPQLLTALTALLNTTAGGTGLSSPILGQPNGLFGRIVAGHMVRVGKLTQQLPSENARGVNALQSLLAMAIYFCQPGVLAGAILPSTGNVPIQLQENQIPLQTRPANTKLALVRTRYRVHVGRATLIAYILLSGFTLLICFCALIVGTIAELINKDAEPTLYPALDFWTQCKVENEDGSVVKAQERDALAWRTGQDLFKDIATIKVVRRKRKLDGGSLELPMG